MSELQVLRGNIIDVGASCIVCPTNSSLMPGPGIDRSVFFTAGDGLYNYCLKYREENGPVPVGHAIATPAFEIPANHIIHTVGPYWHGGFEGEAKLLASCYVECMKLAEKLGVDSIAFPTISTGSGRYPLKEAGEIAVYTLKSYLANHPDFNVTVYLMCFSDDALVIFKDATQNNDINILRYLNRKEIKINVELYKSEVSMAKRGLFKKALKEEELNRVVYSVLKRIVAKHKNLILLSPKIKKSDIGPKIVNNHNGRTGPYITLDTVSDIHIEEVKKGLSATPKSISFVIHPFAYIKEELPADNNNKVQDLKNKDTEPKVLVNVEEQLNS